MLLLSTLAAMGSQTVGTDSWEERAERAAVDLEAHRQLDAAKVEVRDALVVEGVDSGRPLKEVARRLHIAPARVHQILARRG